MAAPVKTRRPRAEDSDQADAQYYSRAVAKGLELLEILGNSAEPIGLNQLARSVQLTKPSAFRLLFTLEALGYVRKDSEGRYSLKHDIRRNVRDRLISSLLTVANPHLRELTREFRETTGLAALFDNHIEVVAVVESPQTVRMGNTVGRILQPHASSLGKCITAFQPEERREHLLRSYGVSAFTEHTITNENDLHGEFERIRQSGYATDRGETCLDGYCFGAPISGPQGEVFAAISISMPKMRLGARDYQDRVIERVRAAASEVSDSIRN